MTFFELNTWIIGALFINALTDAMHYKYTQTGNSKYGFYHSTQLLMLVIAFAFGIRISFAFNLEFFSNYHIIVMIEMVTGYLLMRFGIFQHLMNKLSGWQFNYIGTSNVTDRVITWFLEKIQNKIGSGAALMIYNLIQCISIFASFYFTSELIYKI